jgi:hypothetical protein
MHTVLLILVSKLIDLLVLLKKNMSTFCLKPSSHHVRSVASKDRKYLLVVVDLILHCMHTYALVHILVCTGTTDRITVD